MEPTPASAAPYASTSYGSAINPVISRKKWWILLPVLSLLSLALCAVLAFHGYIAWMLARPAIAPLSSNPQLAAGLAYEDVRFASSDGASSLEGWFIPAEDSDKVVVFSHGYGGNREELWVPFYSLAQELNRQHYNVLLFDYGYVQPDLSVTGGVRESLELEGALKFVKEKGMKHTYVWGFSMGAGTALQTALQNKQIEAMILDSMFLLEPDTMFHNIKNQIDLPKFPSLPLIRLFFPILNGTSMDQIPYRTVKETDYPMPIFFIHGEKDVKAPYEVAQEIAGNQSNPNSRLWLLPNARHELIYKANKKEYLRRTMAFLNSVVGSGSS
ncbi:alpha/beta hydrolase [Paenibacillus ginsengarvi]|uniref:Alpha/beta fold hydrolase n=1 Tax=Paenibacillus ginsengarvi TaxID=400777 RepID=A0A3B0BDR9_9BACL|nr:alpha/beta fold hydrolase [Paenibacillus ginsengarvi]RKN71263.1 alpha/beta fold hydrolase [Paenibacillus ginsengarvi]